MLIRENVRSGRKANFYITENSFIDNYARTVGPVCTVIYNVLERYMNCETRSTWVGTAKIAEVAGVTQRTVQRCLKTLEELKLIKVLKNASATIYVVMPVPQKSKVATTIPLFDAIDDQDILPKGDVAVATATLESHDATNGSPHATPKSRTSDTSDAPYKDEQNLFNKTAEQETPTQPRPSIYRLAARVAGMVSLPLTSSNLRMVEAAVVAEADRTGWAPEEAARFITEVALDDARRGVPVNKFYFEDAKWRQEGRTNVRFNRAEQRKLDNLQVNARVKQRLRERLGHS